MPWWVPTDTPGALELTGQRRVFVGGDDYRSGQTKVRFVLADFLIASDLVRRELQPPGNMDGQNRSAPTQFRSKEVSKSSARW